MQPKEKQKATKTLLLCGFRIKQPSIRKQFHANEKLEIKKEEFWYFANSENGLFLYFEIPRNDISCRIKAVSWPHATGSTA